MIIKELPYVPILTIKKIALPKLGYGLENNKTWEQEITIYEGKIVELGIKVEDDSFRGAYLKLERQATKKYMPDIKKPMSQQLKSKQKAIALKK